MAMIQGIDGMALINALRAGKEDRYTEQKRAMDMQSKEVDMKRKQQTQGLLGQLFGGNPTGGVTGMATSSPQANVPPMPGMIPGYGGGTFNMDGTQATPPDRDAYEQPLAPDGPMAAPQQAPPREAYDPDVLRKLIVLDPEMGTKIATAFKSMDENTLKQHQAKNDIMGAAAHYIQQGTTPQDRAARLQHAAPQLMAAGWSQQELQGAAADLSDQKLQGFQAVATDYDKMIDNELAEREFMAGKTVPVTAGGNVALVKPDGTAKWVIGGGPGGETSPPPAAAIDHLRQNPALKDAFDAKYGEGAADRILGGGASDGTGSFRP